MVKKCNNFLKLYESEWSLYTTRVRIQFDNNRSKAPKNLPLAKDIKLLRNYCKDEIVHLLKLDEFGKREWRELAETTLCRISTFNARRGGEPPALTLDEWQDALNDNWKRKEALSFLKEAENTLQIVSRLCILRANDDEKCQSFLLVKLSQQLVAL